VKAQSAEQSDRDKGKALALVFTPRGVLKVQPSANVEDGVTDPLVAKRLADAFDEGPGVGLWRLGAAEVETDLPPTWAFWRRLGREAVAAVCSEIDLETRRDAIDPKASSVSLQELLDSAPMMEGGEYLSIEALHRLWDATLEAFREEARRSPGSIQSLLAAKSPAWNVVGRVHFHLAENKRDPERPFAFLATYTTTLTAQGKPQHRPLGQAIRESSSARDKNRLLTLLAPVQQAASRSNLIRTLSDSGDLFQPLAWTPREAHRFLVEVPALEESGVVVRLPDWWKPKNPLRAQVTVAVGNRAPSSIGLDAMLDFTVRLTVDGQELSAAELRALRSSTEGLVLLKGKWVEVDQEKLDQVLAHWRTVEQQAGEGLSFIDGMRMLSGAMIGATAVDAPSREWVGVEAGQWLGQLLGELRTQGVAIEVGSGLCADLRPYQRDGLQWLWQLTRLKLGACLADDMGLGKTLQVLALLVLMKEKGQLRAPALLVVPASLIANWQSEAERFAPGLRLFIAHPSAGPVAELSTLPQAALRNSDVVVTTYGAVHRYAWIVEQSWSLVVLDEAQFIKNPAIKQTRAVKALRSEGRIALTGTPVENQVGDLWSIFDFLNPGLLGSAKDFTAFIKRTHSHGSLRALVRPYILRRLKTDRSIITDLPDKTELNAYCGLSKRQAALYQDSVDSLREQLQQVDGMKRRGLVLAYLTRFKQICNHPSQWLGDGAYAPDESGKHGRLRELCEVIASRQEKVLVFTQFRDMTAPLARWLEEIFGRAGLVLSGETAVNRRRELVKRFQEDEQVPFFVLSLKAGGTGLNLTAASHVIHFDRWWNPAIENQATDRAFRIGQLKNVLVHKLICRGTIEERIDALIESKRGLAAEVLEGGDGPRFTELGDEELMKLVALDIRNARSDD
jgi:superfamily II DNA or RNA helicase